MYVCYFVITGSVLVVMYGVLSIEQAMYSVNYPKFSVNKLSKSGVS